MNIAPLLWHTVIEIEYEIEIAQFCDNRYIPIKLSVFVNGWKIFIYKSVGIHCVTSRVIAPDIIVSFLDCYFWNTCHTWKYHLNML